MNRLPLTAVAFMVVGMSLIPAGDTAGKLLTTEHDVSSFFVAWSRFALGLVLLAMLLWRPVPFALLRDWRIWLRGALIAGGIASILTALKTVPLADAFGTFFVGPVVSFALSVWLLREPFEWQRAMWLGLGFLGVLLITRPGFGTDPGILFAVLAGVFYGSFLTASRWLADSAGPRDLLLSQLTVGAILLAPFHEQPLRSAMQPGIWIVLKMICQELDRCLLLILRQERILILAQT